MKYIQTIQIKILIYISDEFQSALGWWWGDVEDNDDDDDDDDDNDDNDDDDDDNDDDDDDDDNDDDDDDNDDDPEVCGGGVGGTGLWCVDTRENEVREHIPVPYDNLLQSILSFASGCQSYF